MMARTVLLMIAYLVFCTLLAQTFAQEANEPLKDTSEAHVRHLIAMVESTDSPDRDLVIRTLGEMKADAAAAVPVLCVSLSDEQYGTRAVAVDALVAIDGASVNPVRELLDSPLGRCRAAAATALIRLDKLQVHEMRRLTQDVDQRVRVTAVNALRRSGATDDVAQLVSMLSDTELVVAVQAALSLRGNQNRDSVAIPGLIKALPRKDVGWAAADALGSYGINAQRAIPWIIKAYPLGKSRRYIFFSDSSEEALQHMGPPHKDDIPLLCECLQQGDIEARILAADCFVMLGSNAKDAVAALDAAIDGAIADHVRLKREAEKAADNQRANNAWYVLTIAERCAVAVWNGTHDASRFLATMQRMAEQTGYPVVYEHPTSWNELPTDVYPLIESMLRHRELAVRLTALHGIAEFGPKALPLQQSLLLLTEDPDPEIAARAIATLAGIGPRAKELTSPRLFATFQAGTVSLREFASAAEQLDVHSVEAREILEKGLQDPDKSTAAACAKTLVAVADDRQWATARIIKATEDKHITRRSAIQILKDQERMSDLALPFLQQQLRADDIWDRADAIKALGSIGVRATTASDEIRGLLGDDHIEVRLQAAKAILLIDGDSTFLDEQLTLIFAEREIVSGEPVDRADQYTAVETIAELRHSGARYLSYVISQANSGDSYSIENAIRAIEAIGTPDALAALEEIAESTDWVIRSAATEALQRARGSKEEGIKP